MPRFFVTKDLIDRESGYITVTGDDARHIARSLRMAVGEHITACDGSSVEYGCILEKIRDEECLCRIVSEAQSANEPPVYITLFMAYPKGDKLETVIQKAVELGASKIVPFESSRCIKRPKAEKIDKVVARLSRIAEEAAKQCGRAILPEVSAPLSFREAINEAAKASLALICYECERDMTLRRAISSEKTPKSISVIVGAEGGFSPEEIVLAINAGCKSVSLGSRILRCETAPSYVLSSISYEFEMR